MKEDFLYEGKTFKKGEEYYDYRLPARFLSNSYVEFPPIDKALEMEKIPSAAKSVDGAKVSSAAETKPTT